MLQRLCALFCALAVCASPVRAEEPPARELKVDLAVDGAVTGGTFAAWVVPELLKAQLAPATCHWCHRTASGEVDVNAFDRGVRSAFAGAFGVDPAHWKTTSDAMAFAVLPVLSLTADVVVANGGSFDRRLVADVLVFAESVFTAQALNQSVKFFVGRQRPFVAYEAPYADSLRKGNEGPADDNLSFYSGHSTAALAMTMTAARIVQLRTGKTLGYWTLVPLGIATSLMRLAADKHWGTDVLTGMATGAAVGFVLPTLHTEW